MSEKIDYSKGVYDAKKLGTGRMFILGVQHMFAMFGATVLVPLLTGLSVSTTLLCAGLGTLLFHLITKKKVPAFLGSSFAYLGGFSIVAPMLADADGNLTVANTKMLPYACAAIAFSGLVYLVASLLISTFGIRRIMKFFPPVVTGPIIISIGLILAPSAITNCQSNWLLAFRGTGHCHRVQHLGQGHGQDPAHPHRRAGLLRGGTGHRRSGLPEDLRGRLAGHPPAQGGYGSVRH